MQNSPLRFRYMEGYSDYYPERTGGLPNGRSIEPDLFDGNLLGPELANLNPAYIPVPSGQVVFSADYKWLNLVLVNVKGAALALETYDRWIKATAQGKKPLTMGQSLAGALRAGLLQAGVPVWLNTPLVDLRIDAGRVTGVLVTRNGTQTLIKAKYGVVVASGGFEHNDGMRDQYQQQPIGTDWTLGAASNTGDGIEAGLTAGAEVALMDDSWWGPVIPLPDEPYFCLAEHTPPRQHHRQPARGALRERSRALRRRSPRHVPEERRGAGHPRLDGHRPELPEPLPLQGSRADPAVPGRLVRQRPLVKSSTIAGLAAKMGVPASALRSTINRFNGFAATGKDLDFKRGDSAYDHYYTDPAVIPNSCLAPLWLPPFYAFKIVPGDLGTKGGLVTDAKARVLSPAGAVIPGLYAAGNASSAVMGRSYAGAGATIGPAMTFGYIAANHIADNR
ncbi:FAD-binding protein [Sphaerisporangium perillae]|uniref:FAD-binding protein n=1 Tax=Sphaerisporangium perillae TaxID=2935860 RepID=UPI0024359970|nr:FAD-binding protein [Sphaerisporangium perillae]